MSALIKNVYGWDEHVAAAVGSLHPRVAMLVGLAAEVGFSVRPMSTPTGRRRGVLLISPRGAEVRPIEVQPVRQFNQNKLDTLRAKIMTWGDPDKVARHEQLERAAAAAVPKVPAEVHQIFAPRAPGLRGINEPGTYDDSFDDDAPAPARGEDFHGGHRELVPLPTRTIVKREPAPTRQGSSPSEGKFIPSPAVVLRTWSDGATDFGCAVIDCDYANDRLASVAVHFGRTHDRTEPRHFPEVPFRWTRVVPPAPVVVAPVAVNESDDLLAKVRELVGTADAAEATELRELLALAEQERDAAFLERDEAIAERQALETEAMRLRLAFATAAEVLGLPHESSKTNG